MTRSNNFCSVFVSAAFSCCCCCCVPSSSFILPAGTSVRRTHKFETSALFAENEGNNNARRNILGLALPVTAALVANAPFLAVIIKPPTAEERETMLTEWCQGEACTLLGGGAGYYNGAIAEGVYDPNLVMPSVEEYAEQSRIAAELASTED
eukprot:CAMPEP_0181126920 /NCGR_PEP_ID=MMETSP1071-20121207/27906_1 /TAXON_ID=35127 /ORGANISM="Thalassiosira sp., Strain NH16" /LENGTH=151 /DNA_ID=CAMNT_0023212593 /DNA_START=91 /DNA_END=546 /DNA_ORIENTATION=+